MISYSTLNIVLEGDELDQDVLWCNGRGGASQRMWTKIVSTQRERKPVVGGHLFVPGCSAMK